ncbi:MAG: VWA domain-containing protein [Lachnospiraceae bacterium]|nr:VWA domain-containing protein [Lachnospiraceae bacterium]
MSIEITNPLWLLLIPAVAAGLVLSGRYFRMHNKKRKIKYMIVRGILALLLILTLAGPSFKITTKQITTLFLVDLSDSNSRNLSEAEDYIRSQIEQMPKKNQVGVVVFGDNVLVDQFVTDKKIFSEFTSEPVSTATNLEKAVSTALSIFPEDSAKRLVLITDGLENAGSITKMAGSVTAADVDVKIIKLEQKMEEEVYVSDLTLPEYVHEGDNFQVKVTIQSNVETQAVVSLYSGRNLKGQSTVNLTSGTNQFVFQDVGEKNGTQDYRVMVEALNDTVSMNNEYCAFTQVESNPRILVVEGEAGEGDQLAAILDACGVEYDKITPTGIPEELSELVQYKAVAMVNVNAYDLRQGFLDNLESYVRDYAGGLICTGGDNSFAMGAYQDTPLETVLPVNMFLEGEEKMPTMSVVMVIDHSGSMSAGADRVTTATCLDLAKQAAIAGAKTMKPQDEVAVLAFDDTYSWAVPMTSAQNQSQIETGITTITDGGGTSIFPALNAAADELNKSDSQIKHIILLTDGQDYYDQYQQVIKKINDGGITLSSVAIGMESDQQLLEMLANQCDGRYYYCDVSTGLPKIFEQEIILSGKSYLINEEFVPVITANSELIEGLMSDGVPTLLGYIGSTAKPQATVILQSEDGDPILSTWQFGLGRTIAWNSDASNEWTANWASWDNYVQLWDNMINYVVSNTSVDGDSLEVTQDGNSALITYKTEEFDQSAQVKVVCTDTDGNTQEIPLDPIAPGEYQASMTMEELGIYTISLQNYHGEELQSSMISAVAMQYSPEYRFDLVSDSLDAFAAQTDADMITYDANIFEEHMQSVRARANLAIPLLITALVLFMFDIIARRMNIDYIESLVMGFRSIRGRPSETKEKESENQKQSRADRKKQKSKQSKASSQTASDLQNPVDGKQTGVKQPKSKLQEAVSVNAGQGGQGQADRSRPEPNQADMIQGKPQQEPSKKDKPKKERPAKGRKADQQSPDAGSQALNMEELLRKKEERKW